MRKLLFIGLLFLPSVLQAQWRHFPGMDSAEKVITATRTAIPQSQTITSGTPFKVAVTLGDGAKFAKVTPKPFIVTLSPQAETDLTGIEEFRCSAVSNDTLTLIARSPVIGHNLSPTTWPVGSRLSIRVTGDMLQAFADSINALAVIAGASTPPVTSIQFNAPLTGGTITSTGTVGISQSGNLSNGYLSSTDWNTFNGKQNAISVTSPLTLSGATLGITKADGSHNGYIASVDWNTFNNKASFPDSTGHTLGILQVLAGGGYGWSSVGAGTVTSVDVSGGSSGLTFSNGPIVNTGTINLSGGALNIAYGGTGGTTQAQAARNILPDTTGKTLKYLRVINGGGIIWDTAAGGSGSGTVTSVAETVPSFLSISGSPVTTSGTLAISLSGTALPYSSGGTGQTSWTKGDLLYASATNALSKLAIGSANQILTVNGSGVPAWVTGWNSSDTGTVASVGVTMPATFNVSGSPVTSTGTIAITYANETGNTVLAAPDGSTGTPSYRSLVANDIPSLDASKITTGTLAVARGGTNIGSYTTGDIPYASGSTTLSKLAVGTSNQVIHGGTTPAYTTLATDATLVGNGISTSFGLNLATANTWTGAITDAQNGIATTYTNGLTLANTTASTSGVPVQQSPSQLWISHVWNLTATATDSEFDLRQTLVPVSATADTATMFWAFGNANLGFTNRASLSSTGVFTATTFAGSGASLTNLNGANISTVPIANGGTGQTTQQAAIDALAGTQSSGTYLRSNGTHTTLSTIQAGDVPTLNQNTTGSAATVTGTVGAANGGTGRTSLTAHDLLAGNGTNAVDTVPSRAAGKVLTSNGPGWYPTMMVQTLAGALVARDTFASNGNGSSAISRQIFDYGYGNGIPMFATIQFLGSSRATNLGHVLAIDSASGEMTWIINSSGTFGSSVQEGVNVLAVANSPNGAVYSNQNYFTNPTTQSFVKDTILDNAIQDSSIVLANMITSGSNYYCDIRSIKSGQVVVNVRNLSQTTIASGTVLTTDYFVVNPTPDGRIATGKFYLVNTGANSVAKDTTFNILTGDVSDTNVYIYACPVHDASSTATYYYSVAVEPKSTWPAGGFTLRFHNGSNAGIVNDPNGMAHNEGCTIEYVIVKPSQKLATQSNWNFAGAPIAVKQTSGQIVLGTGKTTTISATAPTSNQTQTIPDFGQNGTFMLETNTGGAATCGTGTLVSGTATITTTAVGSSSLIFLTDTKGAGVAANIGSLYINSVTNGTSFVVNSTNALDASTFNWFILNP